MTNITGCINHAIDVLCDAHRDPFSVSPDQFQKALAGLKAYRDAMPEFIGKWNGFEPSTSVDDILTTATLTAKAMKDD